MAAELHESQVAGATSPVGGQWQSRHDGGQASEGGRFGRLADEASTQAAEAMQPVKESARKVAQDQKNVLADRIGGFANALNDAAGQYSHESPAMGEMLGAAAGSIKGVSDSLRDRHVDDLTTAVQDFARSRPGALFAGAIVAGFALSRFLKSSAPEQSGSPHF